MCGLLWAWSEGTDSAVRTGLADEAWRVREMAAEVAAKRLLGGVLPELVGLRGDPVARVRVAADRAIRVLTAAGA
ncbi:hypothetical protein Acsp01_24910 [Actinoplanes sp. NBRC 101535]|nr:hypothetical protein Acsp01_24910 [Actinoplanes sp. NBRC 101535]